MFVSKLYNSKIHFLFLLFLFLSLAPEVKADSYVTCSTKFDLIGDMSLTSAAKIAKKHRATFESILEGENYIGDISFSARLVQKKKESGARFLKRRNVVQDIMKKKIRGLKKEIGSSVNVKFEKDAPMCTASS